MADLPRLRRHTDGRLAQWAGRLDYAPWHVTVPTGRPMDGDRDDPALCYHTADEQVHGEGWSELAVVELLDPDPDAPAHPTWRDGCGNPWHAQPDGVIDEFGLLVADVEKLRRTAATLLAVCAAVERLRAEHRAGTQ